MSSEDSKPPASELGSLSQSFADRLTFPTDDESQTKAPATPSKFNWADEVTTPIDESKKPDLPKLDSEDPKSESQPKTDDSSLGMAQTDGANVWIGGSGLEEPAEYDVDVKLADLRADPENPLYSVKQFKDLNL